MMRKILPFFVFLIPFYSINAMARSGVEVEVGVPVDDGYYEDTQDVWIGPGFYYGYWFEDEGAYHGWYRNHYHHRNGHRHSDGRHHDGRGGRHHGGGGHHGGGRR